MAKARDDQYTDPLGQRILAAKRKLSGILGGLFAVN